MAMASTSERLLEEAERLASELARLDKPEAAAIVARLCAGAGVLGTDSQPAPTPYVAIVFAPELELPKLTYFFRSPPELERWTAWIAGRPGLQALLGDCLAATGSPAFRDLLRGDDDADSADGI